MRPAVHLFVASVLLVGSSQASASEVQMPTTTRFASEDGLLIEADLYIGHPKSAPMIVLFHQAGWSRGEYRAIAVKLVGLGFNAMAIDARSGGRVGGVRNETKARAVKAKKGTRYLDALPDLRAALRVARKTYTTSKVIAWGSSYSAALVLRVAGDHPELVDAVLSFAPGEYFTKFGKSKTWVRDGAAKIAVPVFITSAKKEHRKWKAIFAAIGAPTKASFLPKTQGNHGSRALWSKFSDSADYWRAVRAFLTPLAAKR